MPDVPRVACFDTGFHRGHAPVASLVPLPRELCKDGVERYGFHGISYEYIASILPEVAPEIANGRVIVSEASAWLGLEIDDAANAAKGPRISGPQSKVSAWVIPTNEELMIARHTQALLGLQ